MGKTKWITFTVRDSTVQLRLDKALSFHPEIKTRSRATKLIHSRVVLLNDRPVKASHKTSLGESFKISIPIEECHLEPYDFPLDILFEDTDLLVLNKPSGLVVHPAQAHQQETLVNALINKGISLSKGGHEMRPGIVHRLDKDTSGILVVAKNDKSHTHLSEQFKNKGVLRSYRAIVFGSYRISEGSLSSYLARHPKDRKKYASIRDRSQFHKGKQAITHYKTLEVFPSGLSLVRCQLETGRTHQIRVHMSEGGHPLIGDNLYGGRKAVKRVRSQELRKLLSHMNRIGLHACELGFCHPKTGTPMHFQVGWPENLTHIMSSLKCHSAQDLHEVRKDL